MKSLEKLFPFIFCSLLLFLTSCELIGDIFKSGVYVGIAIVVIIIVLIIWLVRKIF